MRRVITAVAVVAVAIGVGLATAPDAGARATGVERVQSLEAAIFDAVNELRASRGLRPLQASAGLQAAAVAHSRAMLDSGFFEHESADGSPFHERVRRFYPARGFASWTVGENLLYKTAAVEAAEAVDAWLASPPHRRNMLSATWREVGIGAVRASTAGGVFRGSGAWVVTMDFGTRTGADRKPQRAAKTS